MLQIRVRYPFGSNRFVIGTKAYYLKNDDALLNWLIDHNIPSRKEKTHDGYHIAAPDTYYIEDEKLVALFLLKWT